MNLTEIATKLVKVLGEKYAKDGQTEFPVASLVNELKGVDLSSVMTALQTLQSKGLVSLLGSGDNTLVKLIPEVLQQFGGHENILHKGLDAIEGLFKK